MSSSRAPTSVYIPQKPNFGNPYPPIRPLTRHPASNPRTTKPTLSTSKTKPLNKSQLTMTQKRKTTMGEVPPEVFEMLGEKLEKMIELKMENAKLQSESVVEKGNGNEELKFELDKTQNELRTATERLRGLSNEIETLSLEKNSMQSQLEIMKRTVETANYNCEMEKQLHTEAQFKLAQLVQQLEAAQGELECVKTELAKSEDKLLVSEKERRRLHNEVMELKGNVRVFCRVRPPMKRDGTAVDVIDENNTVIVKVTNYNGKVEKLRFGFDRAFGPSSTQEIIFEEISQLVQSSLDGYQTCIFAYGQTGSGKTYTMEGEEGKPGMIPLTVHQIFSTIEELKGVGWQFKVRVKYVEIYNNNIFDLLVESNESKKLTIKYIDGNVTLPEASVVNVDNGKDVDGLISIAVRNRSVAETKYNAHSSRSHSVFIMEIYGKNFSSNEQRFGGLTLVDLAGSEKVDEGVRGERLEETKNINVSLCALGTVIAAIANKEGHVPYRNSKLTELLQPCLGDESKTLMFVNISPDNEDVSESVSSLRFATKVNTCVIGTAKRHVK
ncbi:kifc1, putative [Entamoeba invadens IP1]|uniref:Kifc1, putative n=1 Tax=Entamoeba invadens IP1 TaxID=370355 RepID=A0A0A1TYZ4_ENTIV|nr:kifc1, putative [Entamoeba invadens IP1]ELP83751.1 kifc1, putative [Entamoeba invadens IP1]|eukprot:XP_004183097.1 kifc1, putative [Entamoeba invadens IP1]